MNPNAKITDEQFEAYKLKIRELAQGPFEEMQKDIEVTNTFPDEFYELCKKNDLYRYYLPSEYGGWDLNELEILEVQEEFSRGPGGMRMHLHHAADMNWRILEDYGKPEVKAKLMDKFQDKTIYCNFAITEATGGTGADLHTTAVKDENGDYILNGEKWLISHTDCSDYTYVIAVTDPNDDKDSRLSAFLVDNTLPGFEIVPMPHMMGCRGAGHAGLRFTNVKVPKECLLGEEGQGMEVAMHSLDISRVHIAASNLGMSQRMLEITLDRAHDRVTFGKPIIQRQAIKMKLAEMAMMIHGLRCMVYDWAKDYDLNPSTQYTAEKASMCKLFSIETVKLVSDQMLEIFGGIGYFEDCEYGPVERLYRDCRAMWLEEGTPTVQRITIAKHLVDNNGKLEYNTGKYFD